MDASKETINCLEKHQCDYSHQVTSSLESIKFDRETKKLKVLDQTALPSVTKYIDIKDSVDGHKAITNMVVRGAPCIAAVGCLSIVAEMNLPDMIHDLELSKASLLESIKVRSYYLTTSRPTAVNLRKSLDMLVNYAESVNDRATNIFELIDDITNFCVRALENGIQLNRTLGNFGAEALLEGKDRNQGITILTHCNTGSLATVGYGTALGVIRSLRNKGVLKHVYCTETRPYNQGSRLTAYELVHEKMPATLICDSMVASLMSNKKATIDAVIVGADCVAKNGDTANKIGTLQMAIIAKHFGVPFYVAAPTQSIDFTIESQDGIHVEQRPSDEMKKIGCIKLAPDEIDVWNPCFDLTPAKYITGIITEYGLFKPENLGDLARVMEESINGNDDLARANF